MTTTTPYRQVGAMYDDSTIAVYQAYAPEIADPAVAAGTFVPPFGMSRMTWIKPSFGCLEQTIHLQPQPKVRSLQVGLAGAAVTQYVDDWITRIEDVTESMHAIHALARTSPDQAIAALPVETPYPLPESVARRIAATPYD